MAIERERKIEVVTTEVSDACEVEMTVLDEFTGTSATVSLTQTEVQNLVDELLARNGEAVSAYWEDRARTTFEHGFDKAVRS